MHAVICYVGGCAHAIICGGVCVCDAVVWGAVWGMCARRVCVVCVL